MAEDLRPTTMVDLVGLAWAHGADTEVRRIRHEADPVDLQALRRLAPWVDDVFAWADSHDESRRCCAGDCGLAAEPGDIFCPGCREGEDRRAAIDRMEGGKP